MDRSHLKELMKNYLSAADIEINGNRPWDIQILDNRAYEKVLAEGSLGLGESYMDNWWECQQLDEFIYHILKARFDKKFKFNWYSSWYWLHAIFFNLQTKSKALLLGKKHYDLGNDLFQKMLDKRMTYSCAYWKDAANLDEAQEAKLELICKKIYLEPGMKVLDIGCGWGSFAKYAAENYQVKVVGITVSKKQLELGAKMCQGLPVELRFQDYRDLNEQFDRIVSVGQMEHVGYKNYRKYFDIVNRCLRGDGLFLLHSIGGNESYHNADAWMHKYIFPVGMIPSIAQLSKAFEGLFVMEDWHNFGAYYDKTLMAWFDNFNKNWDTIKGNYDNRFYLMWKFYLLSCAGSFRARHNQLWQVVLSKEGVPGGYESVREVKTLSSALNLHHPKAEF